MTNITSTNLADGRELLYFDDAGSDSPGRTGVEAPDRRDLPPRSEPGEVRFDALTEEWVAVAAHRQGRTHLPPADQCPICPRRPATPPRSRLRTTTLWFSRTASRHWVRRSAPFRTIPLGEPAARPSAVAKSCRSPRTIPDPSAAWVRCAHGQWWRPGPTAPQLNQLPGIKQVFPFENRGADIGVTLHHPHGQIYAYPYVTPRAGVIGAAARKFFDDAGGRKTLTGSLLRAEREDGSRMVLEGENFRRLCSVRGPLATG
ncbi:galactose-1-phosphate uridylyltransferase, partial [Arthrobacter sp. Hiyo6]